MSCGYDCENSCEECELPDMIIDFVNGYNQALEDFVMEIKECCSIAGSCDFEDMEKIKEQLKR